VCLREQRPFLRKCSFPPLVVGGTQTEDVLENARLLVERLFDQK
jgi:hypothetical protein